MRYRRRRATSETPRLLGVCHTIREALVRVRDPGSSGEAPQLRVRRRRYACCNCAGRSRRVSSRAGVPFRARWPLRTSATRPPGAGVHARRSGHPVSPGIDAETRKRYALLAHRSTVVSDDSRRSVSPTKFPSSSHPGGDFPTLRPGRAGLATWTPAPATR